MADEFLVQSKTVRQMDQQIDNYVKAGKKEAANRLKDQLLLLEVLLIQYLPISLNALRYAYLIGKYFPSLLRRNNSTRWRTNSKNSSHRRI